MEERAAVCPGIKAGQKNCHNKKEVLSNVGQKDIKKDHPLLWKRRDLKIVSVR